MTDTPTCFFEHLGSCEGRLVKAHLIPKQRIRRALATRAQEMRRHGLHWPVLERDAISWDPRCWTWMCGGPTGIGGHHGMFDAKQIRIPYEQLPPELLSFAEEYGLEWSLDRDFAH